jgi:hypothetical protein
MLTANKACHSACELPISGGAPAMKFPVKLQRPIGAACALVLCVALATAQVIDQDNSVKLQFHLERGEVLHFATSTSVQISVPFSGVPPTTSAVHVECREASEFST